jgi:hypothetical protein
LIVHLATTARFLFGFAFFINGVNWWWKVLPYPTIGDAPSANTPAFVQAMIDTGFLFDAIKVVEVIAGVALLANVYVPLALVVAFPVSVAVWAVDIGMLGQNLRAQVMGWAILLLNGFLLLAYIDRYLPMLAMRAPAGAFWIREGKP